MGQSLGGSDVEALGCSRCGSRAAQVIVEACSSKKQAPETSSPPQVGGSTAAWVLEQPCGHVHSGIATGSLCGPPNNEGLACLPASLCLDAAPPLFEVPPEVDVYEEDGDKSRQALEHFMHTLADGVGLRLLLEGCGALHVKGSLDCETWVLRLAFNSIEKKVPLQRVRNVSLQEVASASHVVLELEGEFYCTFVFCADARGAREASFFGGCLQMLVEGARFDAVKAELNSLGAVPVAALDGDQDRLASCRSQCSWPDAVHDARDLVQACSLSGPSPTVLVAALQKVEQQQKQQRPP
mmetsp:Transcript_139241/g.445065  ORF Transcript_139241/g.445065 Transcript_139241/m.445065 type:complete len:297 (+) Transcript_139241:97-987(+)